MGDPARIYPKADTKTQWFETLFGRGDFSRIEKILLHTTETTGWPGYSGGASAPTLTYHPRQRAWRQHNYLDRSARALVDPTSTPVRENRDNVIQIEIIAYADEAKGRSVGGLLVSQMTDAQLQDLADFIKFVRSEWGGPPLVAAKFLPYPQSYGNSSVRMTSSQYDAFQGVLGHEHAPGNDHGDPGALNVNRIIQLASPVQEEDIMASIDDLRSVIRQELAGTPKAIWEYPLTNRRTQVKYGAGSYVEGGAIWAQDASRDSAKALAEVAALRAAFDALAANPDLSIAEITEAAKAGAAAALDEKITGADVTLTVDPDAAPGS